MDLNSLQVEGTIAEGFDSVRQVFADERDQLGRGGGALCVYLDGEKIVDLWSGQAKPGTPWRAGTASCLMSATKGLAGACALVLYDRGLLDVDAPVATYWPEFAAGGKAAITVRQLLSNTAGLPVIPRYGELFGQVGDGSGFDVSGFDQHDEIHRRLAAAEPAVPPGTPAYGIITFGYLVGALVRRISGRSLAHFFHEEVAGPLDLELWMGRATATVSASAAQVLVPDPLPPEAPPEIAAVLAALRAAATDATTVAGQAWLAGTGAGLFDPVHYLGALVATPEAMLSGGGFGEALGTARGLARMYAMLSCGGRIDGKQFVTATSVADFATVQTRDVDAVAGTPWPWTMGFHGNMEIPSITGGAAGMQYGPSNSSFGKDGLGGQVGFADPENRVAIGFVRNHHVMIPEYRFTPTIGAGMSQKLIEAVYAAIQTAV